MESNLVYMKSNHSNAIFNFISLLPKENVYVKENWEIERGFPGAEVRDNLIADLLINYFMQDRIIDIISKYVYLPYQNNSILCRLG